MSTDDLISITVGALLCAYLIFALLRPERF